MENYAQGYLVEWDIQSAGTPFCDPANSNSVGLTTTLDAVASATPASGIHIEAHSGPYGQFAYLLMGTSSAQPGLSISEGRLCLGTQAGDHIGRYNVFGSELNSVGRFDDAGVWQNLAGTSSVGTGFDLPLPLPISGMGSIGVGQTWHFQLMHREPNGALNFSNGLSIQF
ncbi:MAG: hypothetical protein P1V35_14305 [Planctomycetota bacterium]|nr:hypothetical protein [Planctomycetota bacterium]